MIIDPTTNTKPLTEAEAHLLAGMLNPAPEPQEPLTNGQTAFAVVLISIALVSAYWFLHSVSWQAANIGAAIFLTLGAINVILGVGARLR